MSCLWLATVEIDADIDDRLEAEADDKTCDRKPG